MTEFDQAKFDKQQEGNFSESSHEQGKEEFVAAEQRHEETQEDASVKSKKKKRKDESHDIITSLKQELGEMKDKYVRLYAEYDNFRRRTAKEKIELSQKVTGDVLLDLLPVVDDFERAIQAMENLGGNEALDGVKLIYGKFIRSLEQKGVKAMDAKGTVFDTDLHDAMTQIPAPSEDMKGKVVDVLEKGYVMNERVIRHAKVVVGV